ncbi:MAG: hypothetical protein ACXWL5_04430 [Candidatus Chromulinivorax sp.]
MKNSIVKYILFFISIILCLLLYQSHKKASEKNQSTQEQNVKIQGFWTDMASDMAIMLATQQGASLANAQLTTQGQLLASMVSKNTQTIKTSMQGFQTKSQKNQQQQMQSMVSAFSQAQEKIQSQTSQTANDAHAELNYIYQNISIDQPQQNYIFSQIQYDQLFSLGTMLTPAGPLWKNPFCVGDWEYDKTTDSFWQYQNSPMFNVDGTGQTSSLQAENNAIYAEYFTKQASYTITGSITLYQITYPFFAGIIFNKARWISGSFESIRKCRMMGIYGANADNVGVYFAQQYTMTEEQMKTANTETPIQTPLQQIINNMVLPKVKIPSNAFESINTEPITFNFKIKNSPDTVTVAISSGTNPEISFTINKLDSEIFMYHGIGFICPSAICQFKLTEPTDFIFTQDAIANYQD